MRQITKYLKMMNPFNNMEEMPTGVYIIKKLFAFLLIYAATNVLQQVVLMAVFYAGGYDPVQGNVPAEHIQMVMMYYSFAIYILLTFLYCKFIEKRSLKSLGFQRVLPDYFLGAGAAVILLETIMAACCITGGIHFDGVNQDTDFIYMIALFGGLAVQGAAEEIMGRGFLMTSLLKKMSVSKAIFWSATAFAFPHFFTLFGADFKYAFIGVINLYLVSVIFSLLMLCQKNIWISCGLHSVWNFLLYGVFGLTLSGNESGTAGILAFTVKEFHIVNGGSYGVESSIITTLVLGVTVAALWKAWNKKGDQ